VLFSKWQEPTIMWREPISMVSARKSFYLMILSPRSLIIQSMRRKSVCLLFFLGISILILQPLRYLLVLLPCLILLLTRCVRCLRLRRVLEKIMNGTLRHFVILSTLITAGLWITIFVPITGLPLFQQMMVRGLCGLRSGLWTI